MTTIASHAPDGVYRPGSRRPFGLSARLIVFSVGFLLIAELVIFIPSATAFFQTWILDRVTAARMVVLALPIDPSKPIGAEERDQLVAGLNSSQVLGARRPGVGWIMANGSDAAPTVYREVDIRFPKPFRPTVGTLARLLATVPGPTLIRAPGLETVPGMDWVEVVIDEPPIRDALLAFTRSFLVISLIASTIAASMLYLALHLFVVRPVTRLTTNITAFAGQPDDAARVMRPSGRSDEIGMAERALARMETVLANELRQKRRLAELGLAVSKINHELRNILTTAQLLGDRLGELEDPAVRRIAPRLIATLNRAIDYCGATLSYGRASEPAPQRRVVKLRPIVVDQLDISALAGDQPIAIRVAVDDGLTVDADPEQLARILLNLVRNAVEALIQGRTTPGRIDISAQRRDHATEIRVADNGPGIPARAQPHLFSAFQASERSGGTGLGLPVADELVRLHGGSIRLVEPDTLSGANFVIVIPDRPAVDA